MYCAYDKENNIIAIHDKKRIVKAYIDNYYESNGIILNIGKIKESSEYKLKEKDDLYLIKYGNTYIPSGYVLYNQLSIDPILEDDEYALDVLYRILEVNRLNKKEVKIISNAIKVMERLVKDDKSYTPSKEELDNIKNNYELYLNHTGLNDKC